VLVDAVALADLDVDEPRGLEPFAELLFGERAGDAAGVGGKDGARGVV